VTDRLLTIVDVAETLACSSSTVKRLARAGELPLVHVRLPGRRGLVRIRESDLGRYIGSLPGPDVGRRGARAPTPAGVVLAQGERLTDE
jgi:excisionase family DNA binding protein